MESELASPYNTLLPHLDHPIPYPTCQYCQQLFLSANSFPNPSTSLHFHCHHSGSHCLSCLIPCRSFLAPPVLVNCSGGWAGREVLVCSICRYIWCKYSHHSFLQSTNLMPLFTCGFGKIMDTVNFLEPEQTSSCISPCRHTCSFLAAFPSVVHTATKVLFFFSTEV